MVDSLANPFIRDSSEPYRPTASNTFAFCSQINVSNFGTPSWVISKKRSFDDFQESYAAVATQHSSLPPQQHTSLLDDCSSAVMSAISNLHTCWNPPPPPAPALPASVQPAVSPQLVSTWVRSRSALPEAAALDQKPLLAQRQATILAKAQQANCPPSPEGLTLRATWLFLEEAKEFKRCRQLGVMEGAAPRAKLAQQPVPCHHPAAARPQRAPTAAKPPAGPNHVATLQLLLGTKALLTMLSAVVLQHLEAGQRASLPAAPNPTGPALPNQQRQSGQRDALCPVGLPPLTAKKISPGKGALAAPTCTIRLGPAASSFCHVPSPDAPKPGPQQQHVQLAVHAQLPPVPASMRGASPGPAAPAAPAAAVAPCAADSAAAMAAASSIAGSVGFRRYKPLPATEAQLVSEANSCTNSTDVLPRWGAQVEDPATGAESHAGHAGGCARHPSPQSRLAQASANNSNSTHAAACNHFNNCVVGNLVLTGSGCVQR